jgi:hypothetical protein
MQELSSAFRSEKTVAELNATATQIFQKLNTYQPVSFSKFNDIQAIVKELEMFRVNAYPDSIISSYNSIQKFGLPMPTPPVGGKVAAAAQGPVDYTAYVFTHIRDWATGFMIEDKVLDTGYE